MGDSRLDLDWLEPLPGGMSRLQAALREPPPTPAWTAALHGLLAAAVVWWLVLVPIEHWRQDASIRQRLLARTEAGLTPSWRELDRGLDGVRVHLAMARAGHVEPAGPVR